MTGTLSSYHCFSQTVTAIANSDTRSQITELKHGAKTRSQNTEPKHTEPKHGAKTRSQNTEPKHGAKTPIIV